ncbi:hypothetical protein [Citrobacter freundii]
MADAVKVIDVVIAEFGAEPVAYMYKDGDDIEYNGHNEFSGGGKGVPLYTAPPAQVVPELKSDWQESEFSAGWNACRASMLQAGNHSEQHLDMVDHSGDTNKNVDPVSKPYKLSFDEWLSQQDGEIDVDCGCVMTEVLFHWMRVAYEAGNSPVTPDCWCRTCRPVTMSDMRFVVCHVCGNKRCPHANDHRNACTGSNESGQIGSAYPAAPQQEVK